MNDGSDATRPVAPMGEPMRDIGFDGDGDPWLERLRDAEEPFVLRRIGNFELVEEAGRGGQGIVYRARDTRTDTQAAVKVFLGGSFATTSARQRVRREVAAARVLDHQCIVKIRDVQAVDGQTLLVMEWVNGLPITAWAASLDRHARFSVFSSICATPCITPTNAA